MPRRSEAPQNPRELFPKKNGSLQKDKNISESEITTLPLQEFSRFVVQEQPNLLAEVRAGRRNAETIAQRQRDLLMNLKPEEISQTVNNPQVARFAMLDLSFAMSGLTFSGVAPPLEVQQLNAHLAQLTGLPKTMTFEKVVSINARLPFHEMRTFTDGEAGNSERRFYYGHDLMDSKMQDTTHIATVSIDVIKEQREAGIPIVTDLLTQGAKNMRIFADFMKEFITMSTEHFRIFRQYLTQYPDGTRNASGAFMGMPRLNMRLVGLSPMYEEFLDLSMKHFPVSEQADIHFARTTAKQGDYLVAQCERLEGEPQRDFAKSLIEVVKPIRDFRVSHFAIIQYHIPDVLPEGLKNLKAQLAQTEEEPIGDNNSNSEKGTGAFLAGPFLRNILRLDMRAIERLETIINKV